MAACTKAVPQIQKNPSYAYTPAHIQDFPSRLQGCPSCQTRHGFSDSPKLIQHQLLLVATAGQDPTTCVMRNVGGRHLLHTQAPTLWLVHIICSTLRRPHRSMYHMQKGWTLVLPGPSKPPMMHPHCIDHSITPQPALHPHPHSQA
jgi:hypothetical protein